MQKKAGLRIDGSDGADPSPRADGLAGVARRGTLVMDLVLRERELRHRHPDERPLIG